MLAPALHVSRASTPDRRLSASSGEDTILPAITIQDSDRKESKDSKDKEEDKDKEHQDLSRLYLTTLVWACVLAQLWRYIWLLHLTYVPLLYTIIKRLGEHRPRKPHYVARNTSPTGAFSGLFRANIESSPEVGMNDVAKTA